MAPATIPHPKVVSREQWLAERKKLLAQEKALTKQRDRVNPRQTGVIGVKVTQEMVDVWLETLDESEQVLKGKKLIPFWRGKASEA